jgi:hypothetical protein
MAVMADTKCMKFGMLYPGYGFHPYYRPECLQAILPVIEKYTAIFVNEGPVWERLRGHSKVHLVPFSADHTRFKKTRNRAQFKQIIQVARPSFYKGRHISKEVLASLPYQGSLFPRSDRETATVSWNRLVDIYQNADGFLSPNMIGPPPRYEIDAKYSQATMEAGLSGCIIFWHDCMSLGNSFETVFPISLEPKEIVQRIQDVVSSIDLDKHSTLTAQEFYEKCNAGKAVQAKVEIMKRHL